MKKGKKLPQMDMIHHHPSRPQNSHSLLKQRNKINLSNLVSHVTQHSVDSSELFYQDSDRLRFLALLKEASAQFSLRIFAFCLMTNHIHLLFQQLKENLSSAMRFVFREYSLYFNHKYSRRGHLFRGRFRQSACFDEYYLLSASIYIHRNPVAAGLVPDYKDYRWSSWRLYTSLSLPSSFVDPKTILNLLSPHRQTAVLEYRRLMEKKSPGSNDINSRPAHCLALRLMLSSRFPGSINKIIDSPFSADEIREGLRPRGFKLNSDQLSRRGEAIRQLQEKGYKISEIAAELGVSNSTVWKWGQL